MKFNYIRRPDGRPFAVIATDLEEGSSLRVAYSVCNPADQFIKSRARQIAVGRLEIPEKSVCLHVTPENRNAHALRALAYEYLANNEETPRRLRKVLAKYRTV